MPKKWKPTTPWLRKLGKQAQRAFAAWHPVQNGQEPGFGYPFKANKALARNVYLYAAAMGQKRGLLPAELGGWTCWGYAQGWGQATIMFGKPGMADPILVPIENLNAWPAPPVEEMEEATQWQMAA